MDDKLYEAAIKRLNVLQRAAALTEDRRYADEIKSLLAYLDTVDTEAPWTKAARNFKPSAEPKKAEPKKAEPKKAEAPKKRDVLGILTASTNKVDRDDKKNQAFMEKYGYVPNPDWKKGAKAFVKKESISVTTTDTTLKEPETPKKVDKLKEVNDRTDEEVRAALRGEETLKPHTEVDEYDGEKPSELEKLENAYFMRTDEEGIDITGRVDAEGTPAIEPTEPPDGFKIMKGKYTRAGKIVAKRTKKDVYGDKITQYIVWEGDKWGKPRIMDPTTVIGSDRQIKLVHSPAGGDITPLRFGGI